MGKAMERVGRMIFTGVSALFAALFVLGCVSGKNGTGDRTSAYNGEAPEVFAVKTILREQNFADPKKGLGVYARYTELAAEGKVPEALLKVIAEVNERAKKSVETRAGRILSENGYPPVSELSDLTDGYSYRNISYIVNVTRADGKLFSILETETENGIGDSEGTERVNNVFFHSSVYDTQSGRALTPADFVKDPESLSGRLSRALLNKYDCEGLYGALDSEDGMSDISGAKKAFNREEKKIPAWTADYLGLRFYFDADMISEEKRQEEGLYYNKAVHVSIPYEALDGPYADTAKATPECFIAQLEKNTEYALPYDKRVIRVEKAMDQYGYETYRIVIRNGRDEKYWWLEYADDNSDYYLMRTKDGYYFYRLQDTQDQAFVYDFESPDGGFDRFANQNAQCFDSFMHELYLAVPYDPECVHMRERSRKFMDAKSALNTVYAPNGHYSFIPEQGRGRTWLHFALIDDVLLLDSHNIGCRLIHEMSATGLDDAGKETGEIQIPAGEVLRFLRVDGESELYYYMSPQYSLYSSGARDYRYDCALSDGREVRLVTRYENSLFVDGMYLDRIAEPVTLGVLQNEAAPGELPEHFVEIGGKKYRLIRDLSLKTEAGEEIDFSGDVWWKAENYAGTFSSENEDAKLIISENGEVRFDYQGRTFTGKLPEKRYYLCDVEVFMEAGYEERTFRIIVNDKLPPHDPSFCRIRFYSEGLPATNEPSKVPPIEVELLRE